MAPKKNEAPNKVKNAPTTGHEWDGIQEYNNPLPRWWLWSWFASIVFSIGYVIYYPAIPFFGEHGFSEGTAKWSQYKMLQDQMDEATAQKAPFEDRLNGMSAEQIKQNPELYTYALEAGKAEFSLQCSQCHGAGGAGAKGYPNLQDDEWIWGGQLNDIVQTIRHGIRSTDDENTRDMGAMMAYGKEEILDSQQVRDVVNYIKTIAYKFPSNDSAENGKLVFAENCVSCHGENGEGMQELGAPALNNPVWLYGGDTHTLTETIMYGRAGVMPSFTQRGLSEGTIQKLALYVESLSGGEK